MNIKFITVDSNKPGFLSRLFGGKQEKQETLHEDLELATLQIQTSLLNLNQEKFSLTAFRDQYEYDAETWMSRMTHAKMWEIVLPCSHDSFTHKIKNYIPPLIKVFIRTQSYSIADQLKMGVREFDIRICKYQKDISSKIEIWTSHTALCQPLDDLLKVFKDFIISHQSEILNLSIKADTLPMNLDANSDSREIVHAFDTSDINFRNDIFEYVFNYFGGKDLFITEVDDNTLVKDLWRINKRILLFVQNYGLPKCNFYPLGIYGFGSWSTTKSMDVKQNHELCDKWMQARPPRSFNYWKSLAHQVTFEPTDIKGIIDMSKAVLFADDGIQGCAEASNQLMIKYIYDKSNGSNLLKCNSISVDFAEPKICKAIIDINFMYIQ